MFNSLRLLALSFFYYFGFTYAAFISIKQRTTTVVMADTPAEGAPRPQVKVLIGIPALKLMIMLTSMALLSLVGADWFPLFAEMRVIFMYTLLFAPPFTQQELYDKLFAPLLLRGGSFALSLQTSDFLSRKVSLFLVRRCVDIGIAAMNYTQRSRSLDDAAVRDILSGLRFSQRALQEVADLARASDGATYTQLAQDSNFAVGIFTSHVRRALVAEAEHETFNARAPLGRVVHEDDADSQSSLPVATATTSTMSPLASTRSDGFSETLNTLHSYTASESVDDDGTASGGRSGAGAVDRRDRSRRGGGRHRKKFLGLF